MNITSKLLIALAGLTLAAASFAGDPGPRHDRGHAGMGAEVIEHVARAVRRLDLSEEQRTAIHAELQGMRETMKPLVHEMLDTRKALHEQITADQYDAQAVAEIAERQGSLTSEMTIIASGAAASVLAQLSEEQRAELQAMAETRRAHRGVHKDMRKFRRERTDDETG